MTVGIIVGTYSSIYIASPFALLWEQLFGVNGKLAQGQARCDVVSRMGAAARAPGGQPRQGRQAGSGPRRPAAGPPAGALETEAQLCYLVVPFGA